MRPDTTTSQSTSRRGFRPVLIAVAVVAIVAGAVSVALFSIYSNERDHDFRFSIMLPPSDGARSVQFGTSDADALGLQSASIEIPPSDSEVARVWFETGLAYVPEDPLTYCFREPILLSGAGNTDVLGQAGLCIEALGTTIDRSLRQPIQIALTSESSDVDVVRFSDDDAEALGLASVEWSLRSGAGTESQTLPTGLQYDLLIRYLEHCFLDDVTGLGADGEQTLARQGECVRSAQDGSTTFQFVSG